LLPANGWNEIVGIAATVLAMTDEAGLRIQTLACLQLRSIPRLGCAVARQMSHVGRDIAKYLRACDLGLGHHFVHFVLFALAFGELNELLQQIDVLLSCQSRHFARPVSPAA